MTNKTKVILAVLLVAVLLIFYLLLTSQIVTLQQDRESSIDSQKIAQEIIDRQRSETYKTKLKQEMGELRALVMQVEQFNRATSTEVTSDELKEQALKLKERILKITVPENFKELHVDMVLMTNKLYDFIDTKDKAVQTDYLKLLKKIEDNNPWLSRTAFTQ